MLPPGPRRPRLPALLLGVALLATAGGLRADELLRPGTDLLIHRFEPQVAPEAQAPRALRAARGAASPGMSSFAAQQVADLQAEKAARTPAQAKIDSRHLYTARMLLGQPAAPGVPYLRTGVELDGADRLVLQISAEVTDALLARLAAAGARVVEAHPRYHSLLALVPAHLLETVAAWPEIRHLGPRPQAIASSAQGDVAHQADLARSGYRVDGTGVKIGVLSDGVQHLADSQRLGALGPVTVLTLGGTAQTGRNDEGTAMLEIVHALAPGATLYFATAFNSIQSFADNIHGLRAVGCDILVDDVSYFVESRFQDGQAASVISNTNGGIVAQAVNDVVADGALYFSAAANDGNLDSGSSGVYEGDFVDGGPVPAALPGPGRVHLFAPGVAYNTITAASSSGVNLTWADPLGAAADDYDLYLLDSTGTTVLDASNNLQDGRTGSDPEEYVASQAVNDRVVVVLVSGAARCFNLNSNRGRLLYATSGAVYGHNAASGALTIAATPAAGAIASGYPSGPYPGAFTASALVEPYSSDGPRRIFFQADGTAITPGDFSQSGGLVLPKPDLTAADGVSVTGVGGFPTTFYGTSAAAPHAAAIAALLKSAAPAASAAELTAALRAGAIDLLAGGWDRDSGAGVVMPVPSLRDLAVPGYANPVLASFLGAENPGDGDGLLEAGEGGRLAATFRNDSVAATATGLVASLASATPGVSVALPADQACADLAPGASGSLPAPFRFTLGSGFDYTRSTADFLLTLSFAGGTAPSRTFTLAVPVGAQVNLTSSLGTAGGTDSQVAAATGLQAGRSFRDGNPSACGTAKTWPGLAVSDPRAYDAYTFTACRGGCAQIQLASADSSLFMSLYSPAFVPASIGTNYLADSGSSGTTTTLQADFVAGQSYTVVLTQVDAGAAAGTAYTLTLPGWLVRCGAFNQAPVAQAADVAVDAGPDGTAAASVDNGSHDPDGDPVVLTQAPAGPHPTGVTRVLLTVTDPKGAIAQAQAGVTVARRATHTEITSTSGRAGSSTLTAAVTAAGAVPTGTVSFTEAGTALGQAALDGSGHASLAAGSLAVGSHQLVASYAGTPGFLASASAVTEFTVITGPLPTVTILAGAGTSLSGAADSFTATVTSGGGTPGGMVQFLDGSTLLGRVALSGGTAVFATAALAPGSHSITAVYEGNTDFQGSGSAALGQTVTLDLRLVPDVASLNLVAGQSASFHLALSSVGALVGPVSLQCTGLPAGVVATFTPVPGALDAVPATVTVTLGPASGSLAAATGLDRPRWPWLLVGAGLVALPSVRRRRRPGALAGLLALVLAGLGACGGGGGGGSAPAPVTTPYTLQFTADSTGATQGQASITLELIH